MDLILLGSLRVKWSSIVQNSVLNKRQKRIKQLCVFGQLNFSWIFWNSCLKSCSFSGSLIENSALSWYKFSKDTLSRVPSSSTPVNKCFCRSRWSKNMQEYYNSHRITLRVTRPNEFGSMTAIKYHAFPSLYIAIKLPHNTIKDQTKQCKAMKYLKRPQKTTIGRSAQCHARSFKSTDGRENIK